jgi:hypothetical protein
MNFTEVMDTMYLPAAESYNGLRTIDVDKITIISWMDIQAAAKAKVGKRRNLSKLKILKFIQIQRHGLKIFIFLQ